MSDVDGLLAAFESGRLLRPSPDGLNLVDLANSLAELSGVEGRAQTEGARRICDLIGPADHIVYIAIDGLGMNLVERLDESSFLRRQTVTPLMTVFPSSTPTVFSSLASGEWPSTHAVTGWDVYLEEASCTSTIIQFVRRADEKPLSDLGLTPEQAYPLTPLMSLVDRDIVTVKPKAITETPFSKHTAGYTPEIGYESFDKALVHTIERVAGARSPTFTYLYYPDVDLAEHIYGIGHPKVSTAVVQLNTLLEKFADALPANARLVLTADHGQLDSDDDFEMKDTDPMLELLDFEPTGAGRALNLFVSDGKDARFRDYFRDRFGDRYYLLTVDEAESLRLYGPTPLTPVARRRLGDYVAVSMGNPTLHHVPADWKGGHEPSIGHHGGLSPDEMLVPLLIA